MAIQIRVNLPRLRRELALETNADHPVARISRTSDLAYNTVAGLFDDRDPPRRVDLTSLAKIVEYFRQNGKELEPNDVFAFVVEDN